MARTATRTEPRRGEDGGWMAGAVAECFSLGWRRRGAAGVLVRVASRGVWGGVVRTVSRGVEGGVGRVASRGALGGVGRVAVSSRG